MIKTIHSTVLIALLEKTKSIAKMVDNIELRADNSFNISYWITRKDQEDINEAANSSNFSYCTIGKDQEDINTYLKLEVSRSCSCPSWNDKFHYQNSRRSILPFDVFNVPIVVNSSNFSYFITRKDQEDIDEADNPSNISYFIIGKDQDDNKTTKLELR